MPNDVNRLSRMLRSGNRVITIATHEEVEAIGLVLEAAATFDEGTWLWSIVGGLRRGTTGRGDPVAETEHPAAALYHLSRGEGPFLAIMLDLGVHLGEARVLRAWRELVSTLAGRDAHFVMIDPDPVRDSVVRAYSTPFEPSLPTEEEVSKAVREELRQLHKRGSIVVDLKKSQFEAIVRSLRGLSARRVRRIICDVVSEDHRLDGSDIDSVLVHKRRLLHADGLLEFIQAPTSIDDIGGMSRLKAWLAVRSRSLSSEAAEFGVEPPRGVLLLGVQGAGKSLCAKAIATAWQRPLLRLDPGVLYDRYVGESERRLRDSLAQADAMAPIVLWIDEIEKAFASAASRSTDGGLSQRMFGTLLTWMQEHREAVFLVATANDIEALPPELLRKGRFDEIFFVDLPGSDARRTIFEIHLRRRGRDTARFDLGALAAASAGYSGAEIENAVRAALHEAFARTSDLDTPGLMRALTGSPPLSVTMAERMQALREWARGRCVPAD
jgi:hypothetical protein